MLKSIHTNRTTYSIALVVLFLIGIGFIAVTSATTEFENPEWWGILSDWSLKHLGRLIFAGLVFFIVYRYCSVRFLYTFAWITFAFAVLLELSLHTDWGQTAGGSKRWLNLFGLVLQPSEFLKIALILNVCALLSRHQHKLIRLLNFAIPLLLLILTAGLLLLEPDFSATVVICTVVFISFTLAGVGYRYLIPIVMSLAAAGSLYLFFYPGRWQRFTCLTDIDKLWNEHSQNLCYQIIHSMIAIYRGGLWGEGVGESVQKFWYLPEVHTDFIFALIVEEMGSVMGIIVLLAFLFLFWRLMIAGQDCKKQNNLFAGLLLQSAACYWLIQALINAGVNLNLLPNTGLPLPFISYGGSHLLAESILLAWVFRILYEMDVKQPQDN